VRRELLNLFLEDLRYFRKTYSSNLSRVKQTELASLTPWSFEALSPFMVMFAIDRAMAEIQISDVKSYLRKRYRTFRPDNLTYDKIRSFVNKRRKRG
jgi:hypothetical protein